MPLFGRGTVDLALDGEDLVDTVNRPCQDNLMAGERRRG
jgi:hypothetical protein